MSLGVHIAPQAGLLIDVELHVAPFLMSHPGLGAEGWTMSGTNARRDEGGTLPLCIGHESTGKSEGGFERFCQFLGLQGGKISK